ncbi:hypothetical protein TSAR_009382 [Trichomalopsis sarcophagae]|uniref:Uncharacterized protein n=1 Tax=Trichomalopsis sarcophagae TaxID=543379 RepID=A0A232FA49_9HYME|nr:hypothetical protein TSAR_009382 [Trichomalopsis sarcophagae]
MFSVWHRLQSCVGAMSGATIDGGINSGQTHTGIKTSIVEHGKFNRARRAGKELSRSGIQSEMLSENEKAYDKSDLSEIMIQVKQLKRKQVALGNSKKSLGLTLNKAEMSPNQQHIQKEDRTSQTIVASNAMTIRTLNKRVFGRKGSPTLAGGYYQKEEKERKREEEELHKSTDAKNKNGTRKPRERLTRPDALVIKAAKGNSYADILRKIKADSNLTILGNSVNKIRKTVEEDLLLEPRRTEEVKTQELQEAVKAVLVKATTIKMQLKVARTR